MRKILILLALAMLTVSNTGCSRCRSLFRRGSPCGGTRLATPPMLGGAIPLGSPVALQQAVPQGVITQPGCNCGRSATMSSEACPTECVPCDSGYIGDDCGYQAAPGEFFGGYIEGSTSPPSYSGATMPQATMPQGSPQGSVAPQGSGSYPGPSN